MIINMIAIVLLCVFETGGTAMSGVSIQTGGFEQLWTNQTQSAMEFEKHVCYFYEI